MREMHEHDGKTITARWEKSSDRIKWEHDSTCPPEGCVKSLLVEWDPSEQADHACCFHQIMWYNPFKVGLWF